MEDEAVLDRGASFVKHVCDEEEVEGKLGDDCVSASFLTNCKNPTVQVETAAVPFVADGDESDGESFTSAQRSSTGRVLTSGQLKPHEDVEDAHVPFFFFFFRSSLRLHRECGGSALFRASGGLRVDPGRKAARRVFWNARLGQLISLPRWRFL